MPIQSFTPKEILFELDKYIVGQAEAKRSVAIALEKSLEKKAGTITAARRNFP